MKKHYWKIQDRQGAFHFVHRLVYSNYHGDIPLGKVIDHIDGNIHNNAIENLRMCDQSENNCNRVIGRNNTSGYKGVIFDKTRNKWKSQVKYKGKTYSKRHETKDDAITHMIKLRKELHGDFAKF